MIASENPKAYFERDSTKENKKIIDKNNTYQKILEFRSLLEM